MMKPTEVIEIWLDRVWIQEDASAIDDMLVPETIAHGLDTKPRVGPEQFKQFHQSLLCLIGDIKISIDHQMTDGEWVSSLFTLTAAKRGTEDMVETTGQLRSKIVDGKIVDAHNQIDFMSLFEQLGLMPENTLGHCLAGEKMI